MVGVLFVAMLAVASSAHAYTNEVPAGKLSAIPLLRDAFVDPANPTAAEIAAIPCAACHGTAAATEPSGPHGGYTTTTSKCATCHAVHEAPAGGVMLLPAATVLATCETCHDGTGGTGVYGVIKARTHFEPTSDHSMVALDTNSIPGGDPATGGSRDATFSGAGGRLTCTDCHSPHGANVVAAFTGDRARSADSLPDGPPDTNGVASTRILRKQPVGGQLSIDYYGSDWCASCHGGRLSEHEGTRMPNHLVDSESSQPDPADPFRYANVAYWDSGTGTLGRTNRGYVMPDPPVNPAQAGHYPICQQCHEDGRSVGNVTPGEIDPAEAFKILALDGSPSEPQPDTDPDTPASADNPRFQVFPHESDNVGLLVEVEDSLCTNCHMMGEPPP